MRKFLNIKTLEGVIFEGANELSILDSALKSEVNFEYSCKNGQCGICKTTLLDGNVIELKTPAALSSIDHYNKKILTCCYAPLSDILIDAKDLTALKNIKIKTLPARINKIELKTDKIIEIELRLPPSTDLLFLEGQYVDIIGPQGDRRSYSIANTSSEKLLTFWIKEVSGGVLSQYWFNDVKENDLLRIEGPKGSFFFKDSKKKIIFLATGTGIAPVKAILDKLSEHPHMNNNKSLMLYWGNREANEFFWEPDYPELRLKYIPILSKPHDAWHGRTGYVQENIIKDNLDLVDTQVYACGSLSMIESAKTVLVDNGLDEKHFYSDAFVSS